MLLNSIKPIYIDSYRGLCDYVYDFNNKDEIPPQGVVYCPLDQIYHFFRLCQQTDRKYVLVSACSDFGLCYQIENQVNYDLRKKVLFINYDRFLQEKDYVGLEIARCCDDGDRCRITDKYSIKTYAHTTATFDEIPSNIIHWFATNINIHHPKVTCVPFGVPDKRHISSDGLEKAKCLYVNFQHNTWDRVDLYNQFSSVPWATLIRNKIPFSDYIYDVATHKFVLSPFGNGYDCYRTWEAIYAGSIPIIPRSIFSNYFKDLPILAMNDITKLTTSLLDDCWMSFKHRQWDMSKASLDYWQGKIDEKAGCLCK